MGLFSIDTKKLPEESHLPVIKDQVWFPNLDSATERVRILGQPGIKQRLETVQDVDTDAAVFEVNKTVKGTVTKIPAGRPGIVARTSETTFEVHLPVQAHMFDIGSIATRTVEFTPQSLEAYEDKLSIGQLAVARAIRAHINDPQSNKSTN